MNQEVQARSAFVVDISEHLDALYSFALLWTGEPERAGDFTVTAIVDAYHAWDDFAFHLSPRARLFAVLRGLLRNAEGEPSEDPQLQVDAPRSSQRQPAPFASHNGGISGKAGRDLTQALRTLPPESRELLLLHLAGFRYSELAEAMALALEEVGTELARAREALLEVLVFTASPALELIPAITENTT
jgi:RNA polymerase sigma factor (sigma-70 family)